MMGEYIIYYQGKIVGRICDDRFLVKPTKSALDMMPDASRELPYEGAKEMLFVEDIDELPPHTRDSRVRLCQVIILHKLVFF